MFNKWMGLCFLFLILAAMSEGNGLVWADGMDDALPPEASFAPPPLIEEDLPFSPPEVEESFVETPSSLDPDFWPAISQGMILLKPQAEGEIMSSVDRKQMLGRGDTVYLASYEELFSPQMESVIFKRIKPVHHPKTGDYLGDLVQVLGLVKVNEVGEDVSTAEITSSLFPISKHDKIASIDRFVPPPPQTVLLPEDGMEGTIVEVREDRVSNAQHDIVYIDHGSEEGIIPGDQFVVIHSGEQKGFSGKDFSLQERNSNDTESSFPFHIKVISAGNDHESQSKDQSDINIPYREIGTIVVVATQEHTATAKIIKSQEVISKGDTILYFSEEPSP